MNSGENSGSSATPPNTFAARIPHLSSWWPRNAAAGAPKKDEDIVPDEYLDPPSPNPDLQQQATAVQPASGEHGGDRSLSFSVLWTRVQDTFNFILSAMCSLLSARSEFDGEGTVRKYFQYIVQYMPSPLAVGHPTACMMQRPAL
ncbi:hypothetical protein P692DRAFT_201811835 [Suillus brevipes Sb2]|nr:hypothetical protein P692DRAFT_201811835 [Suillus brevipes Sb2]